MRVPFTLIPIDNVQVVIDNLVVQPFPGSSSSSASSSSSPSSSSSSSAPSSSSAATSSSSSVPFRGDPITVVAGRAFHIAVHLQSNNPAEPSGGQIIRLEGLTEAGAQFTPVAALQFLIFGPGCKTAMSQPFYVPAAARGRFIVRATQLDGSGDPVDALIIIPDPSSSSSGSSSSSSGP